MAYLVEGGPYYDWVNVNFTDGAVGAEFYDYRMPGPARRRTREQVPEVAFLDGWEQYLPAFIVINAHAGVSREVKDVIEALEPGRHQFFSVSIQRKTGTKPFLNKDGTPLQQPYYLFHPGVHLDAVWVEKSVVRVKQWPTGQTIVRAWPGREDKVVLRREVVEGHHVWQGQWQLSGHTFFSDELVRIVQEWKWKGLKFTHLREE